MSILRLTDITKRFGLVEANRGASLEVEGGEIHALVGENGAGKSTLMRIVAGMYQPDGGRVEMNGRDVTGWSTAQAIEGGVGMVHQHFMLVPTLTVAENVVLGREPLRGPALDMARAVSDVERVADEYGLRIHARRTVSDLSVGEAQRVEILKTLFRGARLLILDEPTAVLSPPEVSDLWRVLRGLKANGGTIVLITHKLSEVIEVSDRVTVMRQGRTVDRMTTAQTTPAEIARAMVGREVALPGEASYVAGERATGGATLELLDLVVAGSGGRCGVNGVTLSIAPGEIVGVAGVEGNGQTELIETIAGLRPSKSGRILLCGRDIARLDVRARSEVGLAHIPEDRHLRGLVLDYSLAENLILGQQHRYSRGWRLDRSGIAANAVEKIREFDIRPADALLPVRSLSGGNQQKVVIAREMGSTFSCLLAAQPTRGVDVGAIEFIHGRLREARAAGKAILLVSAELSEILALADRVAVMYGGRIVAVLPRADATEEAIGQLMTGATSSGASAA